MDVTEGTLDLKNAVSACGEKNATRITLKRKSDSLALISSYQINSDSDEDNIRDTFLKPQVLSETDSESDSDSDSDSVPVFNVDSDVASESGEEGISSDSKKKSMKGIKAPGELDIDDLPPIKDLQISVKEDECLLFGKVHSIVETLVVIEALPDVPALNLESVLFTKIGQPLGEIFDVFGPVKKPYYTIRFNSRNDIEDKSLSVGTMVYCAPKTKYTQYVFIHQLARMKGSDASWKGDLEPPPGYEEFSDDEEERKVKKERKEARIKFSNQETDHETPPPKKPSFEERMNRQNTMRNQLFSNHMITPSKRPEWFKNAAPGAGRPKPEREGSSKGNIVRSSNFTFQRQAPAAPSSFSFSSGNSFSTAPSAPAFSLRSNQMFSSHSNSGNDMDTKNYINRTPLPVNRPHSSFSTNSQIFQSNSQGFLHANSFQQPSPNRQKFPSQNFSQPNSQSFQRMKSLFQPLSMGYQSNNQRWGSSNQTFGSRPSFPPNTHSFSSVSSSFNTNNSPGYSQSHPCNQMPFDGQGLRPMSQYPSNNVAFPSSAGVGSFQSNGFMPDNPQCPPSSNKPFAVLLPQNQLVQQQGQSFQPLQQAGNSPFSLPNITPFPSQNVFSPQNQQGPHFVQNSQFFATNMPNYLQSNNSNFSSNF